MAASGQRGLLAERSQGSRAEVDTSLLSRLGSALNPLAGGPDNEYAPLIEVDLSVAKGKQLPPAEAGEGGELNDPGLGRPRSKVVDLPRPQEHWLPLLVASGRPPSGAEPRSTAGTAGIRGPNLRRRKDETPYSHPPDPLARAWLCYLRLPAGHGMGAGAGGKLVFSTGSAFPPAALQRSRVGQALQYDLAGTGLGPRRASPAFPFRRINVSISWEGAIQCFRDGVSTSI